MPVSKEFFAVFGARPLYGDTFGDVHDRVGGVDAVVLSHGLWTRLFGANPDAVGSAISLGDRTYRVIGIMPREFRTVPPADLYVPLRPSTTGPGGGFNYAVAARLKPGVGIDQAIFDTMRIPIVAGRAFNAGDRVGAPPVAVVSEQFARKFLKAVNPVGHHIRVFRDGGSIEIVGVAKDLSEGGLTRRPIPVMYVPITQANIAGIQASHTYFPMSWVVRTGSPSAELIRAIRESMKSIDPKQPFSSFATMEEVKSTSMSDERFQMTLLSGLAGIGLLLAFAGIYGLIGYMVAERSREFGIRLALGASRSGILRSVLWQGAVLALIGVAVGAIAGVAMNRMLHDFVYGVSTIDLFTFVTVGTVLVVAACTASFVPAIRAVRLNPIAALRE